IGSVSVPVLVAAVHPRNILGAMSSDIYGTAEGKLTTFGVTGTNGKTSVVYLIEALLGVAGDTTGLSTTAERRIGDVAIVSDLTAPGASEMHGLLARMRQERVDSVAIEVSAQAVVRHRIDGLRFNVVAFNNLS